ncbi:MULTISPECIES: class II aldolase/adducin family protein [Streptomyces]|uniref:class II aldolase/adducin family protein n=1 Tax=Streptomyces TaxID=1883 RepID=UPI001B324BC9|nr:class II aldolase/adducin family protein [Streptomyces sp. AgN23]QTI90602.1 class II aldolase/adducin family protein [Streptomyces sp. AgN23]WTA78574.1 class II aldolase/adducin family protein [Streptomyces antimycoticus]WTA86826.1 class II aldolase/adducin family protein [Streptomyces antimycoticus]
MSAPSAPAATRPGTAPGREEVRRSLTEAVHLLAELGYSEGIAGHVSVRDPEDLDAYWVNPFGMDFHHVTPDNLLLVGAQGTVLEGTGDLNPSVDPLHGELHRSRPDLVAFAHTHSMYGKTWSSLGRKLDPITQDACVLYQRHGLYGQFMGLVNARQEGKEVVKAMADGTAVIMQNHGFLTGGRSIGEAIWLFVVMERAAQSQLMAEAAASAPRLIPHDVAVDTGQALAKLEFADKQYRNLYETTCRRR